MRAFSNPIGILATQRTWVLAHFVAVKKESSDFKNRPAQLNQLNTLNNSAANQTYDFHAWLAFAFSLPLGQQNVLFEQLREEASRQHKRNLLP